MRVKGQPHSLSIAAECRRPQATFTTSVVNVEMWVGVVMEGGVGWTSPNSPNLLDPKEYTFPPSEHAGWRERAVIGGVAN